MSYRPVKKKHFYKDDLIIFGSLQLFLLEFEGTQRLHLTDTPLCLCWLLFLHWFEQDKWHLQHARAFNPSGGLIRLNKWKHLVHVRGVLTKSHASTEEKIHKCY